MKITVRNEDAIERLELVEKKLDGGGENSAFWKGIELLMKTSSDRTFMESGARDGNPSWAPLKESTQLSPFRARLRGPGNILHPEGSLMRSIKIISRTNISMKLGSDMSVNGQNLLTLQQKGYIRPEMTPKKKAFKFMLGGKTIFARKIKRTEMKGRVILFWSVKDKQTAVMMYGQFVGSKK